MEFDKAKQILNAKNSKQYTDEQIREIVTLLEVFKTISINNLLKKEL